MSLSFGFSGGPQEAKITGITSLANNRILLLSIMWLGLVILCYFISDTSWSTPTMIYKNEYKCYFLFKFISVFPEETTLGRVVVTACTTFPALLKKKTCSVLND